MAHIQETHNLAQGTDHAGMALRSARHQRGQIKATLTRFERFLESRPYPDAVALRSRRIESTLAAFAQVQREIDLSTDNVEEGEREMAEFEERYDALLLRAARMARPASASGSAERVASDDVPVQPLANAGTKLPPIALPNFSGDYLQWEAFRDMFASLVHSNARLSNVQKFHYLKGSLRGDALVLIDAYAITDANYDDAWRTLSETFNNDRVLLNNHFKAFSDIAPVEGDSASALKTLWQGVARIQQAMRSMHREHSAWDDWRVFFTVNRLDAASRREWEKFLGHGSRPPCFEELETFLKGRIQMLEALPPARANQPDQPSRTQAQSARISKQFAQARPARAHFAGVQSKRAPCINCRESHYIGFCPKLQVLSIAQRRARIAELKLCFNCLQAGHSRDACTSHRSCAVCQERHHSCLHLATPNATVGTVRRQTKAKRTPYSRTAKQPAAAAEQTDPVTPGTSAEQALAHHAAPVTSARVLLATAIVVLHSPAGDTRKVRALLDPGAEVSFVSESCVQALRLIRRRANLNLIGIGGSSLGTGKHCVDVVLSSQHDPEFRLAVEAYVLKRVTAVSRAPLSSAAISNWAHLVSLCPLADPDTIQSAQIDLLLGADSCGALLLPDVRQGPVGSPTAQLTKLGWTIFGPIRPPGLPEEGHAPARVNQCRALALPDTSELLQRFWEVEELPGDRVLSRDEAACETHFSETHRRTESGRYVVRLPFVSTNSPLWSDTLHIAIGCLSRLEKRCSSDPQYGSLYKEFLAEYESLGHMRQVQENSLTSGTTPFYMPHHGVIRADGGGRKKLRVVFNASQKPSSGVSFNDHLLVGPPLQRDLFQVILAWRRHRVAVTTDIAKMYRQILVDERDADLQRIVWRPKPQEPVRHFRMTTVTYGTSCAPFLAIRTLMQLADDEQHRFLAAANVLRHQCYVDDILTGADDISAAKLLRQQLINLLRSGGFELRKWSSNCHDVLADLPTDWLQPTSTHTFSDGSIKALGLEWSPVRDCFQFAVKLPPESEAITKRNILSTIARLFDPIGWIAPVLITGKILLQDLWLTGLDWDTPVPDHVADAWQVFRRSLPALESINIPRWIGFTAAEGASFELHGFSDASSRAYGAAVYLRIQRRLSVTVTLLAAKSKVAPVKQLSIPRLELCAAALLSRLVVPVRSALGMTSSPVYLWSDSQVVLAWLRGHASRWTTFVANRVSSVQTSLPEAQWRHVPTKDNPADLVSRGVSPSALADSSLWWNGPAWLHQDPAQWPTCTAPDATDVEVRPAATVLVTVVSPSWDLAARISNATGLWRITALCLRFAHNCRTRRTDPAAVRIGLPSPSELHAARQVCIRSVQATAFGEELAALAAGQEVPRRSPLRRLRPFVDPTGVLRVGGRLQRALLPYDSRHPAVLPKRSSLSSILVADSHQRVLHGGTTATLNHLLANYWVLGAKSIVRAHIHRCTRCVRFRGGTVTPLMGNLPAARVTPTRPFLRAGVDYAGPIQLRTTKGRGHRATKGYIALFVCLWSKAIHLEVVSDYSTSAFLAAFRRFISRRGMCRELLSDNGTTFHGADAELKRMFSSIS